MLANGWGVVHDETGTHWVYIPLWDPPKFNEVGRALFTTLVIKQHLSAITNTKAVELLKSVVKEQAQIVAKGFAGAMDDDGWCGTPYPHHHVHAGSGGTLDPVNPVYREALGKNFIHQIDAKAALTLLGKVLGNKRIIEAAEIIEQTPATGSTSRSS
ncbi:MAG TPA: hypothetical protein VE978_13800 [Chitinophagales bacterium]|nr:hypothetical protein [Chitinophagales bacterium]